MKLVKYRTRPFPGWTSFRAALHELGPAKALRLLIGLAWRPTNVEDGEYALGNPIHHAHVHPALCRIALRAWLDQGCPELASPPTLEDGLRLTVLLEQLSDIVHARFIHRPQAYSKRARLNRAMQTNWVSALQMRHRNTRGWGEVGRAWLLLRRYWDALDSDSGQDNASVRKPMESAFDDLEGWVFLALAAQVEGGWIGDPPRYFQHTAFSDQLGPFIRFNVPRAEDVVGAWETIEREVVDSLVNPFLESPIVQVSRGTLIAPDPGTVFPALAARIVRKVRGELREPDRAQERRHVERRLGGVYESFIAGLVQECALASREETFVPEFELSDGTRSPDAHLRLSDHVILVEAKSSQLPEPPDSLATLEGLLHVMGRAAGEDETKERAPLVQALDFILRWVGGDANALGALGQQPDSCTVLLVSPVEWPMGIQWARFRDTYWRPRLDEAAQMLDKRVAFLSHHDLETAAVLLRNRKRAGRATTLLAIVNEWIEATRDTLLVVGPDGEALDLRGGLGDFLFTRYPTECKAVLPMVSEAAEEFFLAAASRGFPREALAEAVISEREDA